MRGRAAPPHPRIYRVSAPRLWGSGAIHSSLHSFPESVWQQTTLPLNVFHPKIEILGRILNGFYLFSFIGSS